MRIHCTLNGAPREIDVDPLDRALDVLRRLGFTGTKEGCGEGECGACTVLLDGAPVNACLVIASQVDGCRVTTIEGLAQSGDLAPVQRAFIERGATQCGICTPGMLLSADYLLSEVRATDARPDESGRFDVDAMRAWAATGADREPSHAGGVLDAAVEREIRTCLAGNICRCTGYDSIVRAVKDAVRETMAKAIQASK